VKGKIEKKTINSNFAIDLRGYILRWWGQEHPRVTNLDDLMPIHVTVTNSGRIALPEIIKNVTIYTSSFKIKFQSLPFYTWAVTA